MGFSAGDILTFTRENLTNYPSIEYVRPYEMPGYCMMRYLEDGKDDESVIWPYKESFLWYAAGRHVLTEVVR